MGLRQRPQKTKTPLGCPMTHQSPLTEPHHCHFAVKLFCLHCHSEPCQSEQESQTKIKILCMSQLNQKLWITSQEWFLFYYQQALLFIYLFFFNHKTSKMRFDFWFMIWCMKSSLYLPPVFIGFVVSKFWVLRSEQHLWSLRFDTSFQVCLVQGGPIHIFWPLTPMFDLLRIL